MKEKTTRANQPNRAAIAQLVKECYAEIEAEERQLLATVAEAKHHDTTVVVIRPNVSNPEVRQQIEALYDKHGLAFAAYLSLSSVKQDTPDLEACFNNAYAGQYDSLEDLTEAHIANMGFSAALQEVIGQKGLPSDAVNLNFEALAPLVEETYNAITIAGQVYAFYKPTKATSTKNHTANTKGDN
jgi:hypothetical protein